MRHPVILHSPLKLRAAFLAGGLACISLPAAATEQIITCPRPVTDQYATLEFDLQQVDIDEGEGEVDNVLELEFLANVTIHQADPARPGWIGPELCHEGTRWGRSVPELDIYYSGFMR